MDIRSDRQEGMSCVELGKKYHRWTHGRQSGTRSHRSSRSLAAPASAYTGKCRWPESPPCGGGPISGPLIPTTATPSHQTRFSAASRLTVRRPAVSARACPAGAIPTISLLFLPFFTVRFLGEGAFKNFLVQI